ncbi:MAG TPA: LCP family protein [Candidatus Saccharimonadia bacterium]
MSDEIVIHQAELDSSPSPYGPRPSSGHHWRRALKWLGLTVLVLGAVAALYVAFNITKISANPFGFGKLKGEELGRINIMMLGVGDPGHAGENLSDTNLLISVDSRSHAIAIISIPRDTRVKIPGYGSGKINTAHAKGGIPTAKDTMETNLGVPVHYFVKANFSGLRQVVDAVGGVDVTNTTRLNDPEYPCDNNQYKRCGFKLAPGKHHLNGATTLKYVRCRKGTCGDDFGRAQRQQEVMQAIRQKVTSAGTLANPIALGRLVAAAGDNIQTDLSVNNVLRLNELTKKTPKNNIYNVVFNLQPGGFLVADPRGSGDLVPSSIDFDDIQEFVQNVFARAPIWSEQPKLVIQNGTTTPGLGGKFSGKLRLDGKDVTVQAVGNALTSDHTTSLIVDNSRGKKPHTIAYLERLLNVKAAIPGTSGAIAGGDVVVVLGSDYASSIGAVSPGSASPAANTSPR